MANEEWLGRGLLALTTLVALIGAALIATGGSAVFGVLCVTIGFLLMTIGGRIT